MTTRPQLPSPLPAAIVADFAIPGIDQIHGVTFDGTHVWFAAGPDGDLLCVDPKTGEVVRRLGLTGCESGTAWDGRHLWQIRRERIDQIDRETGKTLHSIPTPDPHPSGMAWAAGHLWVGSYLGRRILKVDPKTGKVLKTLASDRLVTGVTWAGGELWHGTYPERAEDVEPGELRQIDPETGEVRRRVHLPAGTRISGTEFDGKDRIWLGSRTTKDTLRAVRKP
ncbi:MAG TPA: hypothetical protein VKE69_10530 [Planctomycetota bacterium]|nr:hypothetical protein [Planctomycetota bacterium]